jgi:predicted anti-sigma-YlaC factor YlaD
MNAEFYFVFTAMFLAFCGMFIGSFWAGFTLAKKCLKHPVGSVLLGLVLAVMILVSSATAITAGCTAVVGPPNFH